ncbi:G1 family glutamic endopeptidase [Rathayibacter sp. KR2-224]|uniref:G1 family glutamic endopeptidase n=1 Tax=Rathayibacter sp. KR2-224 TaxID=3400913 RepID=UPI003BFB6FC2
MKRHLLTGAALVAAVASMGIFVAPAAQAQGIPRPSLNSSVGCEGSPRTIVPDRNAVAAHGISAVFPDAVATDPNLAASVPAAMKRTFASNPTWVTNLKCGTPIPQPKGDVQRTQGMQPLATQAVTPTVDQATSYNWSGYRLAGIDFNHTYYSSAGGVWNVPAPYPPNSGTDQESASIWAGIGSGDGSGTSADQLLQAGSVSYSGPGVGGVGPSGTYMFYEVFPYQDEVTVTNLPVNGNDLVESFVFYDVPHNTMDFTLCTSTTNACGSGQEVMTEPVGSWAQQVEWIVERHGFAGHISRLLRFDTNVHMTATYGEMEGGSTTTDTYIIGEGPSGGGAHLDQITMVNCPGSTDPAPYLAQALPLLSGAFDVQWHSTGTTC